jgi:hypothetical protein
MSDYILDYTASQVNSSIGKVSYFPITAKNEGLIGNDIVDDYAKLYNLLTAIGSTKTNIFFSKGTYKIGTNITFPSNVTLVFEHGAILKPASGVTITGSNAIVNAGHYQIFDLSNNGTIAGTWNIDDKKAKWFGVKFDNSTDDTTTIQHCFDNMINVEKVIFPIGTCLFSKVFLPKNIHIKGHTKNKTICKRITSYTPDDSDEYARDDGMFNAYVEDDSDVFENIIFEDITIDGNFDNLNIQDGAKLATLVASSISLKLVENVVIKNCIIKNAIHSGIWTSGCDNVEIIDCDIFDNGIDIFDAVGMSRNGISVNGWWYNDATPGNVFTDKTKCKILNCKIYANHQEGIMFAYVRDMVISNNEIYNNLDRAIEGDTSFVGGDDFNVVVEGNYIHDNVLAGITFGNSPSLQKLIIDNNIIENCGDFVFTCTTSNVLTNKNQIIFTNNQISGSGQTEGVDKLTKHSLYIQGYDIIVANNICKNLELNGVAIQGFIRAKIKGNTFEQISSDSLFGVAVTLSNNAESLTIEDNNFYGYSSRIVDFYAGSAKSIDFVSVQNNYAKDMDSFLRVGANVTIEYMKVKGNYAYDTRTPVLFGNLINLVGNITTLNISENRDKNALYQMIDDKTKITSLITGNNYSESRSIRYRGNSSYPVGGSYVNGEIVFNSAPAKGSNLGWIYCDSAWNKFGIIDLQGSATWNPGDLVDGSGETSASITVTGAALGDFAICSAPYDLQGLTCNAYVDATNSVKIRLQNETGGNVNLAEGVWKVKVIKA